MGERFITTYAPADMWTRRGDDQQTSPADIFDREGITLSKANRDRLHGAGAVRRALAPSSNGLPTLRIMRSCRNLIRTLPALQRDPHNVEDIDTEGEDHLYDAARYGIVMALADYSADPMQPAAGSAVFAKPRRKAFAWENWRGA